MKHGKLIVAVSFALVAALSAGCKSRSGAERAGSGTAQTSTVNPGGNSGAQSGGTRDGGMAAGSPLGSEGAAAGPGATLKNRTIYFDFDKNDVKAEYREVVTANARYLASNPNARVRLEGNTDERGSREYNIGLGERRAQAVKQAMLLQGAAAGQAATVSYGEERPAATGSDEESWALNRRVEIVYLP
jgi:peptidoglycan-associated lipoprotein